MKTYDLGEFPRRLVSARKETGLTQSELGQKARLTNVSISNYEKGNGVPKLYSLIDIALALNVSIGWLVGEGDS